MAEGAEGIASMNKKAHVEIGGSNGFCRHCSWCPVIVSYLRSHPLGRTSHEILVPEKGLDIFHE